MPLKVIKADARRGPRAARALVELEDRVLERALRASRPACRRRAERRYACRRRCSTGSPSSRCSRRTRAATAPATCGSSRRSAASAPAATTSGSASPSTTRCATSARWRSSSKEEVQVLLDRLAGEVDAERAAELIENGAEPLRDLIAALHSKALVAELEQQRAARGVIRRARPEDVPGIAEAMGAPSRTTRSRRGSGRKPTGRREYIQGWYELVAREHYVQHGQVFVAEEDGEIAGCSMWSPPGEWRVPPRVEMQASRYAIPPARTARADREHRDEADRAKAPAQEPLVPVRARRAPAEPGPRLRVAS